MENDLSVPSEEPRFNPTKDSTGVIWDESALF
ncbi:hypothetical protein BH11PSE11_BH11PSE11_32840 [soil metagenome]